ncbi:MAG: LytTR family DNA-binding domain-containing protein [Saprospiraceae bacterium]
MVLKTALVDPEPGMMEQLEKELFRHCPSVVVAARCQTYEQAIQAVRRNHLDLLFLNSEMPGLNPDDFSASLEKYGANAGIIFLTPHPVSENGGQFLSKPINPHELKHAVERFLIRHLERQLNRVAQWLDMPKRLRVSSASGFEILSIEDIVYCEADGSVTKIFLSNGQRVVAGRNLGYIENSLENCCFFRTHHRFLVNLNQVRGYRNYDHTVTLSNGANLPVAQQKLKDFLKTVEAMAR